LNASAGNPPTLRCHRRVGSVADAFNGRRVGSVADAFNGRRVGSFAADAFNQR